MDGVSWIKLQTDIFNNNKIVAIENMPDGDALLVIWLKLLVAAGNSNSNGLVYFSENIPFTEQLLATVFHKPLTTIQFALKTFEHYKMIEIVDDIICVSSWSKYQSVDKLADIKEYNRIAKQKQREKQKLLAEEKERSKEKEEVYSLLQGDIDKEENLDNVQDMSRTSQGHKKKEEPTKIKFADTVTMTQKEYDTLVERFGEPFTKKCIEKLDSFKDSKGKKYLSDYKAILSWVVDEMEKKYPKLKKQEPKQEDMTALEAWGGTL